MPEEIFILSTYLLFGIIGLVAFVIAWELKLIPFLKSKTKQEPGFMGVWRATFADNFSKGEIEYKEHINNKIFYKINTSDYPLALYKYLDWYPISDLPVDNEFDIKIRKNLNFGFDMLFKNDGNNEPPQQWYWFSNFYRLHSTERYLDFSPPYPNANHGAVQ